MTINLFQAMSNRSIIKLQRFENQKGIQVGGSTIISINSTYISPAVAWFTTGAGILLLLAAIAQSVRRVRRNRHEK